MNYQEISREVDQVPGVMDREFDLEERITVFARSAGSVGANYIDANEALSRKDFLMRLKIARKESRETTYWLGLCECEQGQEGVRRRLQGESREITSILSAILVKFKAPDFRTEGRES